jgi:leader peptidase (prepilin peptidase) / N-methyltransferase
VLAGLIAGLAVLGLIVGSFLNVVIYRVPRHLSIVRPGSFCPQCGAPVTPWENVPVVSYVVLKGRCRHCAAPISLRYPLVELLTAGLFAANAARFGFSLALLAYEVLAAGLVALAAIDLDHRILPGRIVQVIGAAVFLLLLVPTARSGAWSRLGIAAASSACWFVLYWGIRRIDDRFLGFGDARLVVVLGFALGWLGVGYVVGGFVVANLLGALVGVALIVLGRATRKSSIPFGPFLASGCEIAVLTGPFFRSLFHGA